MTQSSRWQKKRSAAALIILVALGWSLTQPPSPAQATGWVEFSGSPNPVGSGARALGMGGAFIAVADDATAASWNPGGLIQLEAPEISVVGAGIFRTEDNSIGRYPEASGEQSDSKLSLNYLSASYPFNWFGHAMVVSLNYQQLYDFNRDWRFSTFSKKSKVDTTYRFEQNGGLYAYGTAYCLQVLPSLSFGFTLNFWEDGIYHNGWEEQITTAKRLPPFGKLVRRQETSEVSFTGFNANLGLLWSPFDKWSFGAVFKTPFSADLRREQVVFDSSLKRAERVQQTVTHEDLEMPMSYGLGVAYQVTDQLVISTDVYRTHWEDFVLIDDTGKRSSAVNGLPTNKADIDSTTQFRLGAEYLLVKTHYTIPFRAGFFYDPAPAKGGADEYFGFSVGSGLAVGRFLFDVAYQYRFGNDVTSAYIPNWKFSQDVTENIVYSSLIIHF